MSVCIQGVGRFSSFSLPLTKRDRWLQGLSASPSATTDQAAPHTHHLSKSSLNPQPLTLESHRIWACSCHLPVSTFPLVQTKHFAFETHGVFLTLENGICYLVLFVFPFPRIYSSKCLLSTSSHTPDSIFQRPFPFLFWLEVSGIS